jgi:hypothetical protein
MTRAKNRRHHARRPLTFNVASHTQDPDTQDPPRILFGSESPAVWAIFVARGLRSPKQSDNLVRSRCARRRANRMVRRL